MKTETEKSKNAIIPNKLNYLNKFSEFLYFIIEGIGIIKKKKQDIE